MLRVVEGGRGLRGVPQAAVLLQFWWELCMVLPLVGTVMLCCEAVSLDGVSEGIVVAAAVDGALLLLYCTLVAVCACEGLDEVG